ncbi:MAG: moderate conductance mechanosensitive channel [Mycobacterium sp.]|nr:moderate conductance mechanosensitive channel [Mycobacterium sp.]
MGSWKRASDGATEKMTTNTHVLSIATTRAWEVWRDQIGDWLITRGLRIGMLLIAAVLAVRFVTWVAEQVAKQIDDRFVESDALVRSEASKHRQAVASVIQWVSIVLIAIWAMVQIADVMQFSARGLIAPATVLGAALGFGAQQVVRDLLAGFFIIVEKQYGFGDLVTLTIVSTAEASGTVENVTLRVTRLRSPNGEVLTIPNGQIIKAVNQSKDWARAVVDVPVSTSTDLNRVNEVLHQECERAMDNPLLSELLLDAPTVMGVERIEVDTVTLRLVARTLPGKQFEAGRQLRVLVVRALARAGIVTAADAKVGLVDGGPIPVPQLDREAQQAQEPVQNR